MEAVIKHFRELTADELYDILKLRSAVFVVEQNCIYQDMDDWDRDGWHLYLKDKDGVAAYMRILDKGRFADVSFGRVIAVRRRKGLGTALLKEGIAQAVRIYNAEKIVIGAQCAAIPFYESVGFRAVSEVYDEDGIPHRIMELIIER